MKKITFLFLFFSQFSFAQSAYLTESIDKINFEKDTIQAVYDWVTDNVRYDVAKLKRMESGKETSTRSKYKTEEAYREAKLKKVITRKRGVCEDYALLFDRIVKELGYESAIVSGYSKDIHGKVQRKTGHAWNAVKVNGVWKLYDTTWGSGVVNDKDRFIKKYTNKWYDVSPSEMVKTHMPYDPVWQLSEIPLTYKNFEEDSQPVAANSKYDYNNLLQNHFNKTEKEQLQDAVNRSETMGPSIRLVSKWRKYMTKKIGLFGLIASPTLLEETNHKGQEISDTFNKYINAKNKQFKSKKWTVDYSKQTLQQLKIDVEGQIDAYQNANDSITDSKAKTSLKRATIQNQRLLKRIENELKFLDRL